MSPTLRGGFLFIKIIIMNQFHTFDIFLASTLESMGFPVECLDRTNPNKVGFYFKRDEALDNAVQGYWAKTLRLEPQEVFTHLKMLKNRLHSG